MKNLKKIIMVAIFGAMSFGMFSAYNSITMTEVDRLILQNVEALTEPEPGGGDYDSSCVSISETTYKNGWGGTMICLPDDYCRMEFERYANYGSTSKRCKGTK